VGGAELPNADMVNAATAAAASADLAATHIRKYLELHQASGQYYKMMLLDEAQKAAQVATDASVKLAIAHLQRYLELRAK
jgi:hypothetical protein